MYISLYPFIFLYNELGALPQEMILKKKKSCGAASIPLLHASAKKMEGIFFVFWGVVGVPATLKKIA